MNTLPGGARFDKACTEYCPMLRDLANKADAARLVADSLQAHALEDTQNLWHTLYRLQNEFDGDQKLMATSYGELRGDSETSEQFAALAAPLFANMTPEEGEAFFAASRKAASRTIETELAPVWQRHEQRRQHIGAACLQGPQVALVIVDSKQQNDPQQGAEQTIAICKSANMTAPIDTNNAERLSHLIQRARALGQATRAIGNSPARSATEALLAAFGRTPKSERRASDQ